MCKLDIEDVKAKITHFNNDPINLGTDNVTRSQFQGLSAQNIPAMVVVIDGLFGTQLKMVPEGKETIISTLEKKWERISEILNKCKPDALTCVPNFYENVAKPILKNIPELTKTKGKKAWPYSFATKFFHWCAKEHFPIMDSKARRGIHNFQRSKGVRVRDRIKIGPPTGKEESIEEYRKWINFYSQLLNDNKSLIKDFKDCDNTTQQNKNPKLVISNRPLRILDKYFYQIGKEWESLKKVKQKLHKYDLMK